MQVWRTTAPAVVRFCSNALAAELGNISVAMRRQRLQVNLEWESYWIFKGTVLSFEKLDLRVAERDELYKKPLVKEVLYRRRALGKPYFLKVNYPLLPPSCALDTVGFAVSLPEVSQKPFEETLPMYGTKS